MLPPACSFDATTFALILLVAGDIAFDACRCGKIDADSAFHFRNILEAIEGFEEIAVLTSGTNDEIKNAIVDALFGESAGEDFIAECKKNEFMLICPCFERRRGAIVERSFKMYIAIFNTIF